MHEKIEELVKSSGRDGLTDVSLEALTITQEMFDKVESIQVGNTISTEGLVDSIKKMLGMSNKGEGVGMKKWDGDIQHVSFAIANIRDSFANNQWMKKQTFVTGPIDGKGIVDVIGTDALAGIKSMDLFISCYVKWFEQVKERTDKIRSLAQKNPDTLAQEVKKLPPLKYIKANISAVAGSGEIQALNEAEALALGKAVLKQFDSIKKCYRRDANLLDFNHTKGYKGDDMFFNEPEFATQYAEFKKRVVAALRWIDRSIKGEASLSNSM